MRKIEDKAFAGCTKLTDITIPDGVSIGTSCFPRTWIDAHPNGLVTVGEYVVGYSGEIPNGEITQFPENVKYIAGGAFEYNEYLKKIVIPDDITLTGTHTFHTCRYLTDVTLPKNLKDIPESTFLTDRSLKTIDIPDGVTSIGKNAFCGSSLTSVFLPDSVKTIKEQAFSNCRDLTSIRLGKNLVFIEGDLFNGCKALTSVYYDGTISDWNKITVDNSNTQRTSATRYYYSESNPFEGENAVDDGNYWHYDTNGKIVVWKKQ